MIVGIMMLPLFDLDEIDAEPEEAEPDYRTERNLAHAAEHLVAYDICRRGFDCFLAGEGLRYDLITDVGGLRRVQVKMKRRAAHRGSSTKFFGYTFGNNRKQLSDYVEDADLFAFVAMDRATILYVPTSLIKLEKHHIAAKSFTPECSDLSWCEALRVWGVDK